MVGTLAPINWRSPCGGLVPEDSSHHSKKFLPPGNSVTFIILAMLAFASYQEFIALDMFGRGLHPDWIVLLDGRNDIRNFTTLSTTVT